VKLTSRGISVRGVYVHLNFSDWWVGYYRGDSHHYVCPLPCLVLMWARKRKPQRQ
jgi:hypothetical protein